ncbi:hypothetical protein A9R00_04160 [Oleispira antarctica]|uniref:Uncharacterized protein n=1 Tax=Oleispira antarctica TaxID=188908 RepID=A0A1Y5HY23_OLEAN|nr:hypothetical protein A9R00_04160 [Oleispira antarctica]
MKNILSKIALVITAFNLVACDNMNKDSASADIEGTTIDPIITDNSDTETSITSTSQLVAPSDMKFVSHKGINLTVDLGNQGGPAYLSVYADYALSESEHWQINHDSRILASSMENTQISHNFSIPQHLKNLLIQVWFYDGREPLTKEVEIKNNITISW